MIRSSGFNRMLLCFAFRKPQKYSARCKAGVFLLEYNTWAKAGQNRKRRGRERKGEPYSPWPGKVALNLMRNKKRKIKNKTQTVVINILNLFILIMT